MSEKELEAFKKNMVTLLKIFKDKPNLLVKYILEYDIMSSETQRLIISNKELSKRSKEMEDDEDENLDIPYFNNFKEMKKYYDNIFETNQDSITINYPSLEEPKRDTLLRELKEAIEEEDYEKCVKIRDYCMKRDIILNL
jgi:hypothetical protein